MKIFTSTLFILFCYYSNAQITITQSDVPSIGDTIRYSNSNDANDYVITGPNYTWDYSNLTSASQGKYEYKSALAINPLYVIPFGLFGYGLKVSDGINLGVVSLDNIYNFFNKSATKYTIEGYGAEVSGIPLPSTYSDEDEYYQFPLDYGDIDTSTYDVKINIPTLGYIRMAGTRINIVEGWGTLITPYDTFNTIKVQTLMNEIDSISISFIPFPIGIPRNTTTYKWLCNTEKIPALEVTGNSLGTGGFTPNQIRYRDNFNASAMPYQAFANFQANLTTCTMADTITISNRTTPRLGSNTYVWDISPTTFSYVLGTSNTSTSPKVNFNATGFYSVKLISTIAAVGSGGVAVTDDSTAIDYIYVRDFGLGISTVLTSNDIKVFPNPVTHSIQIDSPKEFKSIQILDVQGNQVMQSIDVNSKKINVSDLSKGTYFLELISNDNQVSMTKFIKN